MMQPKTFLAFIILSLFTLLSCSTKHRSVKSDSKPISHHTWDGLLQTHVSNEGNVNYEGFIQDSVKFNQYINLLQANHPNDTNWTKKEQLAYWINAYNAFTVKVIVAHYPVESIKDIAGSIPFINSTWDIRFINIEGNDYDLNNIEHNILRQDFDEPRIHFAINCASISCPKLLNEAYFAETIDKQLEQAAKTFINNPTKNQIGQNKVALSKIFSWFKGDFTKKQSLLSFINQYADTSISEDASVTHLDYNWGLNR